MPKMTSDHLPAWQALTSFSASVGHQLDQTWLDVYPPGGARPVARMVKAGPVRARMAYQLFAGPALDQVAGQLSPSGALDVDGRPIGIVNLSGGRVADDAIHPMSGARKSYVVHKPLRWRVVQAGLPPLTAEAVGVAAKVGASRVMDLVDWLGVWVPTPGLVAPVTLRYRAPESAGFAVTVPPSIFTERFEVEVTDPRLDRRMVFACLTAMVALTGGTPRSGLINLAAPFRRRR
jgi:hypothetical protein